MLPSAWYCTALVNLLYGHLAVALGYSGGDAVALIQHRQAAEPTPKKLPRFLVGDDAEIYIETGTFADTWIPVKITKANSLGWYDVRVPSGNPKKHENHTDVMGIKATYLREIPHDEYETKLAAFIDNNDAPALAFQVEREAARRKRAQKALAKARDYAKEVMSKGCPGEYIVAEGNIGGNDHFGRGLRNMQQSVELCSEDCDKHEGCKAFEWDPISTSCCLKKTSTPKKGLYDGRFLLCQHFEPDGAKDNATTAAAANASASTSPAAAAPAAEPAGTD